jgi:hypothetical protein
VIGPETYPAGINPLTGLPTDEATLDHRPLAIKISNFPRYVRPQAGLSLADIVFEHYAEGGTSRFTAVFYGNNADRVGPIRSARLIDTVIPEMFHAALIASGSSSGVLQRIAYKDWDVKGLRPTDTAVQSFCARKAKTPTRSSVPRQPSGRLSPPKASTRASPSGAWPTSASRPPAARP